MSEGDCDQIAARRRDDRTRTDEEEHERARALGDERAHVRSHAGIVHTWPTYAATRRTKRTYSPSGPSPLGRRWTMRTESGSRSSSTYRATWRTGVFSTCVDCGARRWRSPSSGSGSTPGARRLSCARERSIGSTPARACARPRTRCPTTWPQDEFTSTLPDLRRLPGSSGRRATTCDSLTRSARGSTRSSCGRLRRTQLLLLERELPDDVLEDR